MGDAGESEGRRSPGQGSQGRVAPVSALPSPPKWRMGRTWGWRAALQPSLSSLFSLEQDSYREGRGCERQPT